MDLFGKYRPIAHLGRGGMADVFLTISSGPSGYNFSKLLVVKKLRTRTEDDPELVTMFVDEARIMAHLRHPNIVQIVEVGLDGGEAFLAMEYLDGLSMRRLRHRAKKERIELPREVEIVALVDVLGALDHAYELVMWDGQRLQIVHRDVTPHNIIVTVDGQVKVLDFGIAKTALRETVTAQGIIKGKLRYMSPEQARGVDVGRATDIFSVGVMLWEASTRRRFWGTLDDQEIARRLLVGTMETSPRAVDPSTPEELDRICRRALAFRVADRYPTATAMRDDLDRYLGNTAIDARRQLGSLVLSLAAEERGRLRTVIERAARQHAEHDSARSDPTTVTPVIIDPASIPDALPPVASASARHARVAAPVFAILLLSGIILGLAAHRGRMLASEARSSTTSREGLALATEGVTRRDASTLDAPRDAAADAPHPVRPVGPPARSFRSGRPTPAAPRTSANGNVSIDNSDPWRSDTR